MKKWYMLGVVVLLLSVVWWDSVINNKSIPQEYINLINNDYSELVEKLCGDDFEDYINNCVSVEWFEMAVDARHGLDDVKKSSFGYSLKDINGDGIVELLLLREDYFVLALYTLNSGNPICLDTFYYKHKGTILSTGEIYSVSSGGLGYINHKIERLESNTGSLVSILEFGHDGEDVYYVQKYGGKREIIDELEYIALANKYPVLGTISNKEHLIKNNIFFNSIHAS